MAQGHRVAWGGRCYVVSLHEVRGAVVLPSGKNDDDDVVVGINPMQGYYQLWL